MHISNDGPEVFSSYASRKSRSEITVWMPWPLNHDLGAELSDLLTTSAYMYILRAAYVQKHRKCELRACLIGHVPRHSSPAGMRNPKFGLSCVHCVIQISQLLLSQIMHFALVWKQSKIINTNVFIQNNRKNCIIWHSHYPFVWKQLTMSFSINLVIRSLCLNGIMYGAHFVYMIWISDRSDQL